MLEIVRKFSIRQNKLADDILNDIGDIIYQHYIYGNSQVIFRLFEKKTTPFGEGYEFYDGEVIMEKDKDRLAKDITACLKAAGVTLELSPCGHLKIDLIKGTQDCLSQIFSV